MRRFDLEALERILAISEDDDTAAWRDVEEFARQLGISSKTGAEVSTAEALDWVQRFREESIGTLRSGDVSNQFALTVLQTIGQRRKLSDVQKLIVSSLCGVVQRRPFPVRRWSDFTAAHLDEPDRIRFVLRLCVISKHFLTQKVEAGIRDWASTSNGQLSSKPRVLIAGYARTSKSAILGLSRHFDAIEVVAPRFERDGEVSEGELVVRELKEEMPSINARVVDDEVASKLCESGELDAVVSGCKVISRSERVIEAKTSRRCAELLIGASRASVQTFLATGLYKFWPKTYYSERKDLTDEAATGGVLETVAVQQDAITWLVTELGCQLSGDFDVVEPGRSLLEVPQLEISCAVPLCTNDPEKLKALLVLKDNIDDAMSELTMTGESESDDSPFLREVSEYRRSGKLPEHYLTGRNAFEAYLRDDQWYSLNEGKYIAVFGSKDEIVGKDAGEVMAEAFARWGYRPIFSAQVTREKPETVPTIRPPLRLDERS